jgi:hypothetical protein
MIEACFWVAQRFHAAMRVEQNERL